MEMKLAIIERLKETNDNRQMHDNNFHSLYVKRHQNVRYVETLEVIVLITPNSACDPVKL